MSKVYFQERSKFQPLRLLDHQVRERDIQKKFGKAALTDFFGSQTSCKFSADILSPYEVDMAAVLAKISHFTDPVETEQC